MRPKYLYLIKRIKDSEQWPKGITIWAYGPCRGWRTIKKMRIE